MTVSIDTSDVRRLALELTGAGPRAVPALSKHVGNTAELVVRDLRSKARGHARFLAFPQSITSDVRGLSAEMGPDKNRRQGALGNLLYFGTDKTAPTLEHPAEALGRALPAFEAGVAEIAAQVVAGEQPTAPALPDRARDSRGRYV